MYFSTVKPEIEMESSSYKFVAGMEIKCTLKTKINPPEVNFTWFSCESANCNKEHLTAISDSSLLRLDGIQNPQMRYLCRATNLAGSANISIDVFSTERSNSKCTYSDH